METEQQEAAPAASLGAFGERCAACLSGCLARDKLLASERMASSN